ncbi:hypothetical protein BXU08_13720 [Sphingomonas sp. LM7]|nr:hypothetical protein BXU08_13720 [Sphingomonas sp. LM7]
MRPALLASGSTSGFAVALGALALPRAPAVPGGEVLLPGRQALAEPGKDLPVVASETGEEAEAEDKNDREDGPDIAFAWFATAPITVATPAPGLAIEASKPRIAVAGRLSETDASLLPTPLQQGGPVEVPAPVAAETEGSPAKPFEVAGPVLTAPLDEGAPGIMVPAVEPSLAEPVVPTELHLSKTTAPPVQGGAPSKPVSALLQPIVQQARPAEGSIQRTGTTTRRIDATAASVRASSGLAQVAAPTAPVHTAPPVFQAPLATEPSGPSLAATVFATALDMPRGQRRTTTAADLAGVTVAPSAPEALRAHVVAASANVEQGALDMRRQEWMGQMVEHIEAMRDASPVRETRISLAPEALGKVDVSIRQEGEHVHVHFTTETQAARQLIADAQPRLSELAEARGLKLGQTSFESGTAGQGANRDSREQPSQPQSLKPRAASPESTGGSTDDRIA